MYMYTIAYNQIGERDGEELGNDLGPELNQLPRFMIWP